ncbi:bifunctional transcriptional activator/DNA repair enzyme Ada [Drosophila busckii]|uniref:bifunctional transcriptional activator/DNA repair enzyme Ada n=1 Tax=Drosophila busckii TaxID=30019 RepID=UPI00083EC770|nr:bifunctional transcriptional activator/DNA repair enzyme Ada [Drosophila busckii]
MVWINPHVRVSIKPLKALPLNIKYGFVATTFGKLLLGLTGNDAICLLYFVQNDEKTSLEEVQQRWPKIELIPDASVLAKCSKIFASDKENLPTIELAVKGTDLQLAVWNELVKTSCGKTCTYTELAELVGRPKAVRAVASAVAKNEISILIPCHRIVSKSGALKYHWGGELKRELLNYEANTER